VNGLGLGCAGDCCAVVCTYMSADCMYASVCLSICYLLRVLFLHLSFVLAITKLSAGTAQVLHRLPAQVQGAEYLWYLHPAEQPSLARERASAQPPSESAASGHVVLVDVEEVPPSAGCSPRYAACGSSSSWCAASSDV